MKLGEFCNRLSASASVDMLRFEGCFLDDTFLLQMTREKSRIVPDDVVRAPAVLGASAGLRLFGKFPLLHPSQSQLKLGFTQLLLKGLGLAHPAPQPSREGL